MLAIGNHFSKQAFLGMESGCESSYDWGDLHIGHPGIDLAAGMVLTDSALDVFLKAYGDINQETQQLMTFHAFCHGMSFLPYAFEQNKAPLKRWATLVLANAMKRILAQND